MWLTSKANKNNTHTLTNSKSLVLPEKHLFILCITLSFKYLGQTNKRQDEAIRKNVIKLSQTEKLFVLCVHKAAVLLLIRQSSVSNHILNCLSNFRVDYLPLVEEMGSTLNVVGRVDLQSRLLKCDLISDGERVRWLPELKVCVLLPASSILLNLNSRLGANGSGVFKFYIRHPLYILIVI